MSAKRIKVIVFDLLDKSEQNGNAERVFDIFMILLIIANVIAVIIEPSVKDPSSVQFLNYFEVISVIFFTIEYLLRLWVSDLLQKGKPRWKARLLFIITPIALIDLASILPFYIPFLITIDLRVLRMFRLFRLFRLLKANRYTSALSTVLKVLKLKGEQLISSLFIIVVLMVIVSVMMFNIENSAQPDKFKSVFDGMWWAVATFTTVGYGDIYPITAAGKILSAVIAILGIGLVAIPTGIITSGFNELIKIKKSGSAICPHCGKEIIQ